MTILSELLGTLSTTDFDLKELELELVFLGSCLGWCLNGWERAELFLTFPTAVVVEGGAEPALSCLKVGGHCPK